MSYFHEILSLLMLLTCFILVAGKHVKSYIRTFRFQSVLLAVTAFVLGFDKIKSHESIDIFIICAVIVLLKVIYIPRLLTKTFVNVEYVIEKDFHMNIPILVLISCGLVVFSYFTMSTLANATDSSFISYIVNSVSVIFIGLLFMISRKKAIGQIIGFLVIENGLFITAMYATNGMPIVVDLGIFIDLITAVLIMGIMVFHINEKFETTDTNKLKKLRG